MLRPGDEIGGAQDIVRHGHRIVLARQRRDGFNLCFLAQHVGRQLDADRARPARGQRAIRLCDLKRRFLRRVDTIGVFGQLREDRKLVRDFMQQTPALADVRCRQLSDQRQHRRVDRPGGRQRRAGIEKAGPRHHGIGGGPAGRHGGAERHVSCALFVAGVNGSQCAVGVEDGVEEMIALHAGKAVQGVDAMGHQRFDDGIAA